MGASILPVALINGKIYFLFGKERDIDATPGWSDFGGGTDKNESFMQTAIREGGEELTGFLGNVKKLLTKYGTYNIDYDSPKYSTYRCHIFPMEYDEFLPYYYNNNQQFLQKHLDKKIIKDTKIFEKTQIKWFSFNDIKKHRNSFRSFYRNVIDLILKNKPEIEQFVKKCLKKNNTNTKKLNIRKRNTRKRF